jgi:hypothetical protein
MHGTKVQAAGQKKRRRERTIDWLYKIKSKLVCKECGENRIPTLDFHHRNPEEKEFKISKMVRDGYSKRTILKEIKKCDVLCSNCHRMLHYNTLTNSE